MGRGGQAAEGVAVQTVPGQHCFMLEDPAAAHAAVAEFLARNGG